MAMVHRCDRCGEDCKGSNCKTVKFADLGSFSPMSNSGTVTAGGDDLCHNCVEALKRWLREPPAKQAPRASI